MRQCDSTSCRESGRRDVRWDKLQVRSARAGVLLRDWRLRGRVVRDGFHCEEARFVGVGLTWSTSPAGVAEGNTHVADDTADF